MRIKLLRSALSEPALGWWRAGWLAQDVTGSDEDEAPPAEKQQPGSGAEAPPGPCIKAEEGVHAGVGGQGSSVAETLMQSLVQAYCSGGDASFDTSLVSALHPYSLRGVLQRAQLRFSPLAAVVHAWLPR